jgi:hypothetical protein
MPVAVASGDVSMGPANVHMGSACGEVGSAKASTKMTAPEVASTKMTAAEVASTEVTAATSMTASTTGKGGRYRDCRTTQEDSRGSYEQCFSQHQDLQPNVSSQTSQVRFS